MPEKSENGGYLTIKNSLQNFDAKDMYLHHKKSVSLVPEALKNVPFSRLSGARTMPFQNVSVTISHSKSTVFKICRQKMCRFHVNGRPIRHIFHRFQNMSASCERSLRLKMTHHNEVNKAPFQT